MEARTEVEPRPVPPRPFLPLRTEGRPAAAGTPAPLPLSGPLGTEPDPRVSIDPLRATDRYRLVMPYRLRP